jgi:basic membrane protein A and related proteins
MPCLLPSVLWRAAGALALAGYLAGCAQQAPTQAAQPAVAPAASAPAAPRPAEPTRAVVAEPPLRVALAYVGPVGDAGWSYAHDQGRRAIEREFGEAVRVIYIENVPEGPAGEPVFRELVAQGHSLVFGTVFGYMEPMLRVARDAPQVKFEHASGYRTAGNMRVYEVRTYEGAYLAGVVAGGMTRARVLGVVASIPIPEVIQNINAFALGARSMNPRIKVKVAWVNSWYHPAREREAALGLMDAGADVLMQTTDSSAVLIAAQQRGKRAFGWDSDMSAYGPRAHLASAVVDFGPYYVKAVRDVLEGTWAVQRTWWGMKEGAIDLVAVASDVPAPVRERLQQVEIGLRTGDLAIWKGPIRNQWGTMVYGADQIATDAELRRMDYFVQGVEGKVPK